MTFEPVRYPYIERDSKLESLNVAPLLPFALIGKSNLQVLGLLDTGATINVLRYRIGEQLGAIWERQRFVLPLAGILANIEARMISVPVKVGHFPVVELGFAWARTDDVPILLGQINFFQEFDVCFHRSRLSFEVSPRQAPPSANPD